MSSPAAAVAPHATAAVEVPSDPAVAAVVGVQQGQPRCREAAGKYARYLPLH
eukprot:CAMPEP_0203940870 /NCGR_PEP_ID=MMETSP0359-20131031/77361_1 /ASSEMBLY_ACC=CAM_ASM_000338 /TAXON_ID=268821 /ORGANISM="Scrippsiella Hangoei, Strain SHTV-5" /LENGTH=51 /DNA_ID=CAMNT_0050871351 /DNA_START=1 /DNA_END=153 /DNA_ORIENTATION=-